MIEYKFREDELLQELRDYVDSTYNQHYATGNIQSTEVIIDRGRGIEFCLGNVDKYSNRYGSKGTADDHRKDLMKILHYGLLALYSHDRKIEQEMVTDLESIVDRIDAFQEEGYYDLSEYADDDFTVSVDNCSDLIDYDDLDITTISIGDVKIGD